MELGRIEVCISPLNIFINYASYYTGKDDKLFETI